MTQMDAISLSPGTVTPLPLWRRGMRAGGVDWVFILPAVAVYVGVIFLPIVMGVGYAFTDWDGLNPNANYVGLDNFRRMITDPHASGAILNTLIIAVLLVASKVVVGLMLALAVNVRLKSRNLLRLLFFTPVIMTPIIVSYLWKYIFSNRGTLNTILGWFDLEGLNWLGEPTLALISILIVTSWQVVGLYMVIFLAGLQAVPPELDEAARMDGASAWQRLRHVTLPMLAPSITVAVVVALIQSLRIFDQIYALTHGGPGYATETLSTMIYRISFQFGEFSYGAAISLSFSLIVAAIVLPVMLLLRRREISHG